MLKSIQKFFSSLVDLIAPLRADYSIVTALKERDVSNLPKASPVAHLPWIYPLFVYKDDRVRALVWELKYKQNTKHLDTIAQMMYEEIVSLMSDIVLFDEKTTFFLIPIPISSERRYERGYNQSEYIARAIVSCDSERTLVYAPQWLEKIKETPKQSRSESREERMRNLIGCFKANPQVENAVVILVDDVVTTGSTLSEARSTLLSCGAKDVFACTIAH